MGQGLCTFESPQLVSAVSGAAPTFAFDASNSNYFALRGQFAPTSSLDQVCTFPTAAQITPIIIGAGTTRTCSPLTGSTTYTQIECPTVIDNQFAAATYELAFQGYTSNPIARTFSVALPTTSLVTATATQTVLVTATVTDYGSSSIGGENQSSSQATSSADPDHVSSTSPSATSPITTPSLTLGTSSSLSSSSNLSASNSPSNSVGSSSSDINSSPSSSSAISSASSSTGSPSSGSISTSSSTPTYLSSSGTDKLSSSSSSATALSTSTSATRTTSSVTRLTTLSTATARASSSASAVPSLKISPDATCGGKTGYTCKGSKFGDCCSVNGWCGSTKAYCGTGCQLSFGTCSASSSSASTRTSSSSAKTSPSPVSALKISADGSCGVKTTCKGSKFGNCCSQYGWCGSSSAYCSSGCQSGFGDCTTAKRFAIRDTGNNPVARQNAITGAGPDYTYPPIPTSTVYVATVTVTVPVATVTVTVIGNAPVTSSIPLDSASQTSISFVPSTSASDEPSAVPSASSIADPSSAPLSSPTPSMTPVSSSEAPSPSVAVPANFCLKVLTPGVVSTDWRVKQTNIDANNGNYQLDPATGGIVGYVARFSIDDQGRLILTTPGLEALKETGHSRGTGAMVRYRDLGGVNPTTCSVRLDVAGFPGQMVLKCTGGFTTAPVRTYTGFRHYSKLVAGLTHLWATDDFTTNEDGNFVIDLGLYTGEDCPVDAPVSSSDLASTTMSSFPSSSPIADASSDIIAPTPPSSSVPSSSTPDASPSATPSTSADTSSSAPSLTPSATSDLSTTPSATPNPVPSNFCLKVLTPGVKSTDWVVSQSDPTASNGAFFLYPASSNPITIARFAIGAGDQLTVTTPGSTGTAVTAYSRGTGSMFRFRAPSDTLPGNTCVVQTDVAGYEGQMVLKCTGGFTTVPVHTYTGFRDGFSNNLDYVYGTDDFTTDTADSFLIELGLFTGGACPDGS